MKKKVLLSLLSCLPYLVTAQRATGYGRGSDYDVSGGDMTMSYIWALVFISIVVISCIIIGIRRAYNKTKSKYENFKKDEERSFAMSRGFIGVFFLTFILGFILLVNNGTETVGMLLLGCSILSFIAMLFCL